MRSLRRERERKLGAAEKGGGGYTHVHVDREGNTSIDFVNNNDTTNNRNGLEDRALRILAASTERERAAGGVFNMTSSSSTTNTSPPSREKGYGGHLDIPASEATTVRGKSIAEMSAQAAGSSALLRAGQLRDISERLKGVASSLSQAAEVKEGEKEMVMVAMTTAGAEGLGGGGEGERKEEASSRSLQSFPVVNLSTFSMAHSLEQHSLGGRGGGGGGKRANGTSEGASTTLSNALGSLSSVGGSGSNSNSSGVSSAGGGGSGASVAEEEMRSRARARLRRLRVEAAEAERQAEIDSLALSKQRQERRKKRVVMEKPEKGSSWMSSCNLLVYTAIRVVCVCYIIL